MNIALLYSYLYSPLYTYYIFLITRLRATRPRAAVAAIPEILRERDRTASSRRRCVSRSAWTATAACSRARVSRTRAPAAPEGKLALTRFIGFQIRT